MILRAVGRDNLEAMCGYGDRMQDYPAIKVRHRTTFTILT